MVRVRVRVRVRDRPHHILRRRSVDAPPAHRRLPLFLPLADGLRAPGILPPTLPLGGRRRETDMGRRCLVRARVRLRNRVRPNLKTLTLALALKP